MPLGFEPDIAQAMNAMTERYGDRLVNSLAQAGQTIETGLKNVTTMKELSSLGQQMSQLSPESPDYQQQLIGLGARHPFAMQTEQAQQMIQSGNQQHLQWKKQQFAIQQAERSEARADRRDAATVSRQLSRDARQHGYNMKEIEARYGSGAGDGGLPEIPEQVATPPTTGLRSQPIGMNMPRIPVSTPENTEQFETPGVPLTKAQETMNWVRELEQASGLPRTAKNRSALISRGITQQGMSERAEDRQEGVNDRFYAGLDAKDDALGFRKLQFKERQEYKERADTAKQAAARIKADGTLPRVQSDKLKSLREEMDNSIKLADEIEIGAAGDAALDEETIKALEAKDKVAIARRRAMAPRARADAQAAIKAVEDYMKELEGGKAKDDEAASYKNYDSLKSGTIFIDPDGKKRKKP
jgi:hypothetical protein